MVLHIWDAWCLFKRLLPEEWGAVITLPISRVCAPFKVAGMGSGASRTAYDLVEDAVIDAVAHVGEKSAARIVATEFLASGQGNYRRCWPSFWLGKAALIPLVEVVAFESKKVTPAGKSEVGFVVSRE